MINTILISGKQAKPVFKQKGYYWLILKLSSGGFIPVRSKNEIETYFIGNPEITVQGKLTLENKLFCIDAERISINAQEVKEGLDWINEEREMLGFPPLNEEDIENHIESIKNKRFN